MDNLKLHKLAILCVKFMPIIFAIIVWFLWLFPNGWYAIISLSLFTPGLSSVLLLYLLAYIFKFCWYHRIFIDYCLLFNIISIIDVIWILPFIWVILIRYLFIVLFPILGILLVLHLMKKV